ncbi:NAD kinase [Metabacillus sediminilitoris]|uniref:NAD kinase n=1 Tax=Metabacillus sediminilitoris TaxID=2567941 RepID=A0A4V3WFW5_9BACI|nr:NAD kinase [Metabacillus sediminilitoris]QGQ47526.1 NAD kinase [Metabacillus sediminilitoris]THF81960.1 NAD kinase [Metabacillus sediminilitoris]
MSDRRNVYFYYKKEEGLLEKINSIIEFAKNHDFNVVEDPALANIIVSIGGDGAFLQAVRKTNFRSDCLYAGIGIDETISLYCDFHIDDQDKMITAITESQIEVRKYPVIEVKIDDSTTFKCLNECSIRSSIIKTFVIDVFIDALHFETFRGDGMLIATPTGSTAYNKSVNGAVVDPMIPCIQVSEIASLNNNLYRTLGSSFILSDKRKLLLKIVQDGNDYPIIGMDNEALSIRNVKQLEYTLSDQPIKTVKLKDNSYWEKVKRTFL